MLTSLLSSFGGYIVAAVVAMVAVAGAYLRGRASGKVAERMERDAKINEHAAKASQEVRNVHEQIDGLSDAAVRERAKRWVRNRAAD